MTIQKEHCDHECVCNKYIDHTNTGAKPGRECNGETWCFKTCPHDTRSNDPEMDTIKRTSDLPIIIPSLPEGDTKDLKVWREYWVKHDATIRNKARQELLEDLEEAIEGVSDTLFGFLPITDSVNKAGLQRWIEFKRKGSQ